MNRPPEDLLQKSPKFEYSGRFNMLLAVALLLTVDPAGTPLALHL